MSELPKGWEPRTLSNVVRPRRQKAQPSSLGIKPFLGLEHVESNSARIIGCGLTSEVKSAVALFEPGDVLYSRLRPYLNKVVRPDFAGAASAEFIVMPENDEIDGSFLHRLLMQPAFLHFASHINQGDRPRVDFSQIGEFEFGLPPLPVQRRIVAKLDSLFARTKAAREELARVPKLVERYKQAVLEKAFRGELTAEWRRTKHARLPADVFREKVSLERDARRVKEGVRKKGANRNTPPAKTDLHELPASWIWTTFEECSWDLTVGHVGPMKDRYVPSGIPFLRSFNVRPNRITLDDLAYIDESFDKELAKSRLTPGTVVVVRTGAPGVAAVIPEDMGGANCSDLVICRPIESLDPYYAALYLNSDFAQDLVRSHQVGVAQQHFNIGAMSCLALPLAPPDEQEEIVRTIHLAFDRIALLQSESEKATALLDRLDQAMLAKAFRGELVQELINEPQPTTLQLHDSIRTLSPKASMADGDIENVEARIAKYLEASTTALIRIEAELGYPVGNSRLQEALVTRLGLPGVEWIPERDLSSEDLVSAVAGYDFPRVLERISMEGVLPSEVIARLDEERIRQNGEIWEIHKTDDDPWPSNPHAHNVQTGWKLDLRNGDLYDPQKKRKESYVCRLKRKSLLELRSRFKCPLPSLVV